MIRIIYFILDYGLPIFAKLIFTIFGLNNNIMLNSQTKNIINPPLTRDALDELKTTIIKML
jgi:hypothetical protein